MMRGTFANIRLRNQLAPGTEGGWTTLPARRRGDDDLRRGDEVQGRGRAAAGHRRQGIRIGIVARLGGEGHAAARREGGDRRELRAHPPQQPGEHGRAAAAVPGRRDRRVARPDRPRALRASPASRRACKPRRRWSPCARRATTARRSSSRRWRASTRPRSWSRSGTAASCRTCCASSSARLTWRW